MWLIINILFSAWDKLYVLLHGSELYFFKDLKHRQENSTFHNEPPIQLNNCIVQPSEYSKRKNVISLRLPFGSEYLFQCADEVSFNTLQIKLQCENNQRNKIF